MWKNSFFWFAQPDLVLHRFDITVAYFFLASLVIGIVLWVAGIWIGHTIVRKLLNKIKNLVLTTGIAGLVWFAFRFELTPIFDYRFWAGLIGLLGLVWLAWIVKYLILNFSKEKREFDHEQVKSKYLPGSKK